MEISSYKRGIRQSLLWALGIVGYYVLFQSFYNIVAYKAIWPYPSLDVAWVNIRINALCILIIFLMNYAVVFRHWLRLSSDTWRIAEDIVLSGVLLVVWNFVFMTVTGLGVDWGGTVFNDIFIFLGLEVVYYVKHYRVSIERAESYRREMLQYQYDALRAQVNPHFLFNSFNVLYSLIDIDTEKTKEFTMALSRTYRYIMTRQGKDTVRLADELSFLRSYTDVLSIRYNDNLTLNIVGEENVGNHEVITYCLQLLMENVTKHNVILANKPMQVDVTITDRSITVSNPIRPRRDCKTDSSGIGLRYISQTHALVGHTVAYGEVDGRFTVEIPFVK